MKRLNLNNLQQLPQGILKPHYNPLKLPIGIVHFGLGAFHRAHQAAYIDHALNQIADNNQLLPAWGICGVSLRSPAIQSALVPQNCLYSLTECDQSVTNTRVIGCIREALYAKKDAKTLMDYLISSQVNLVTITVTEKGYCHNPATGDLNQEHPDIIYDWQHWNHFSEGNLTQAQPRSLLGWLTLAIFQRKQLGRQPLTILSCDNLAHNGQLLRDLMTSFTNKIDPSFSTWIANHIKFPSTMVDRITPAMEPEQLTEINERLGLQDQAAVMSETYSQWVIENQFVGERPAWEQAHVTFVDDVAPYELYKLRLFNGCHSALAYIGYLSGYDYIYEAMQDADLLEFVKQLLAEITPSLPNISTINIKDYQSNIIKRLKNTAIHHRTQQIAMDGSQKLPQRILNTIRDNLRNNNAIHHLVFTVAAWIRYVYGFDENNKIIEIDDPLSKQFLVAAETSGEDTAAFVDKILGIQSIFGEDLANNTTFTKLLSKTTGRLFKDGIQKSLTAISVNATHHSRENDT